MKFYIRGKPWIVTVDDEVLVYNRYTGSLLDSTITRTPNYAQLGDDNSLWGAILEKAWAKVKGSYEAATDGVMSNGLRALTGAPVFNY